ncbi:methyltransferase domain-containing protein [Kribbella sp. NPDC051770]|uniref:class I SAM-dependent methyltransferase n=1 Tax=Kribbella sp. NPDC051770 TaxID=3155413 RepID=UPI00343271BB
MQQPDHYDSFAADYSAENEKSLANAYYERPAVLSLAGEVKGRRVLDAGCGSGPLAAELRARGAVVSAFDGSPAMAELARERLGAGVDVQVADLTQRLPYADGEFDDVVVSLVLHYFRDWTGPLAELRRVVKKGGRLILSVNHPIVYQAFNPEADYFAPKEFTEDYLFNGRRAELTYWHRPLHAMTDAFTKAGFRLSVLSEPPYSPDTPRDLLPPGLTDEKAFVCFLFFVLEAE